MAPAVATYEPRDPSRTVLYKVIAAHLETFLASLDADPAAKGLPAYVQREFYDYLQCGILAHGFLRLGCDTCQERGPPGLQLQAARVLSIVCGPADGPDCGPPGRVRHSLGADAPMGGIGAHALALLDGHLAGTDRAQVHTIIRTTIASVLRQARAPRKRNLRMQRGYEVYRYPISP